jgi:hypothetical protein
MEIIGCYSFQLDDFYAPPGPTGMVLKGSLWSPHRLSISLTYLSFILLVPVLYAKIYWARRAHARTALGRWQNWRHLYYALSLTGISDRERARRMESNSISTTINFIVWLIEVRWIARERHSPAGRLPVPASPHRAASRHQDEGGHWPPSFTALPLGKPSK